MVEGATRFDGYASIEEFAADLLDDDRFSFGFEEAEGLAEALGLIPQDVILELRDGYGFAYEGRPVERRPRGFTTSSHDRWYGPGSSPMHGGTGWEQINGFGGQEG